MCASGWRDYSTAPSRPPTRLPSKVAPSTQQLSPRWSQRWSWWCRGSGCLGGGGGVCLATSCLWAGFAGSTCPCPCAGAFATCFAGAGAFAVIAAGALPFAGAPPLGAAIAVPQRAPQRARAIVSFLSVLLFMVVFLSSLRASSFSRLHKARRFARRLLTKLRGGCGVRQFTRRYGIMRA